MLFSLQKQIFLLLDLNFNWGGHVYSDLFVTFLYCDALNVNYFTLYLDFVIMFASLLFAKFRCQLLEMMAIFEIYYPSSPLLFTELALQRYNTKLLFLLVNSLICRIVLDANLNFNNFVNNKRAEYSGGCQFYSIFLLNLWIYTHLLMF